MWRRATGLITPMGRGMPARTSSRWTTRASLILYPDSSGPFYADLIDEVILTDYTIKAARITASCGSGIRRCLRKQAIGFAGSRPVKPVGTPRCRMGVAQW